MTSAFVLGSTGLVGKQILEYSSRAYDKVVTLSRRKPELTASNLDAKIEPDSTMWPSVISTLDSTVYFSAFGTTRRASGSADKFVEIDYGVNYACAKAAKDAGVKTCVLVSSTGANEKSHFLYFKTKGRLEKDIIDLKFERTIILRPGALIGERDGASRGALVELFTSTVTLTHRTFLSHLTYAIYGEELGRVAVRLAQEEYNPEKAPIVKIVGGWELTQLAKTYT
ncbi:uncharacterized protein RJT20DRAFT_129864 [Scheffersomyces xylosifermentans]|uniref:uncharacterized protein n=1 Tax=Scheffersomyces xylosifermentans TaxID=1304137 RepID=UPI00315DF0B2